MGILGDETAVSTTAGAKRNTSIDQGTSVGSCESTRCSDKKVRTANQPWMEIRARLHQLSLGFVRC
jgi:hypothetical protein